MTRHTFALLSDEVQLAYVYQAGTHVATRWQEVDEAVRRSLVRCPPAECIAR